MDCMQGESQSTDEGPVAGPQTGRSMKVSLRFGA